MSETRVRVSPAHRCSRIHLLSSLLCSLLWSSTVSKSQKYNNLPSARYTRRSKMLANLLATPPLTKDKDLFMDAMQEATDSIIGTANALPPNPFARPCASRSPTGRSYALTTRTVDPDAKITTHHSSLPSSTPSAPPTFSASAPPHLKIPLHHLSPLNSTASGPKKETEVSAAKVTKN